MTATPTLRPRNQYLDFSKGVLIFLVVWGHLIQAFGYTHLGFYEDPLFKAIYLFHMPLFIAISGYLSYKSINQYSCCSIIRRRFLQLIVPAFAWAAIFNIGLTGKALFFDGMGVHGALVHLPLSIFKTAASLWFLWAILLFTVIVAVLKLLRRDTVFFMTLVFALYLLVPGMGKDYLFKFTLPFFCIGYQVARFGVPSLLQKKGATVLVAAVSIAFYWLWNRDDYVYVSQMSLGLHGIQIILFRMACAIAVSIFFLKGLFVLYSIPVFSPFVWFGRRSLEIYILHSIFLKMVPGFSNPFHNPVLFTAFAAPGIAFALCVGCAWIPALRLTGETPKIAKEQPVLVE
jgi:fucose 4-O-acetylase-like acetyltransferase